MGTEWRVTQSRGASPHFGLAQSGREYRDFLSQATHKGRPVILASEQAGVPPERVNLGEQDLLKHLEVTTCWCKWEGLPPFVRAWDGLSALK